MKKIDVLFKEYGESHQNRMNKVIHWICVPLIFWSILGFISLVPAPPILIQNFGLISVISLAAVFAITIFYIKLSWRISLTMIVVMLLMEYIVYQTNLAFNNRSWMVFITLFIISWIGQFYGHKIEGKKPSFKKDLQFLLIGPIWLVHFILRKLKVNY